MRFFSTFIFILIMCKRMSFCVGMCTWALIQEKIRIMFQISWSCSYRLLSIAWYEVWLQNSGSLKMLHMLITCEPFLQSRVLRFSYLKNHIQNWLFQKSKKSYFSSSTNLTTNLYASLHILVCEVSRDHNFWVV